MNKSTEIKINKIELVNVPDDVFNEFLIELSKTREQYIIDDGFYIKLLKINYDTMRKLNIDTRKLKIIEKRYKTTQTSATPPLLNCMTCKNALHTNLAAIKKDGINVRALKKETWTQDVCLKCKDYSNYKLK